MESPERGRGGAKPKLEKLIVGSTRATHIYAYMNTESSQDKEMPSTERVNNAITLHITRRHLGANISGISQLSIPAQENLRTIKIYINIARIKWKTEKSI